ASPIAMHRTDSSSTIVSTPRNEVGSAIQRILPQPRLVHAPGGDGDPTALVDEPMLGRGHKDGHAGKVGYTAYVIPVRVGEKDGTQVFAIVPRRIELVGSRLYRRQVGSQSKQEWHLFQLRRDGSADARIDENVTLRMTYEDSGHHRVPFFPGRAAAVREGGSAVNHPGWECIDRHPRG